MDMKPEFGLLCDDAQLSRLVLQVTAAAGVELAILDSKNLSLNPDLIIMAQPELTADLKPGSVQALIIFQRLCDYFDFLDQSLVLHN